jgi:hypothetical protein
MLERFLEMLPSVIVGALLILISGAAAYPR